METKTSKQQSRNGKTELEKECKYVIKMLLDGYANGMTDLQIARAFDTLKKLN